MAARRSLQCIRGVFHKARGAQDFDHAAFRAAGQIGKLIERLAVGLAYRLSRCPQPPPRSQGAGTRDAELMVCHPWRASSPD